MVIPLRDENPTRRFPIVTVLFIAANIVIYFGLQPKGGGEHELRFLYERAAVPCELTQREPLTFFEANTQQCLASGDLAGRSPEIAPDKNVWFSVLVSMFLHGSILHVLGNMLFLWIFGNNVEDRLGPLGFVVFYAATGIAATATHVAFETESTVPLIGASGAIAGVMGAYLVWFPHARILSAVPLFFFFTLIDLPAVAVLGIWFVMQFFTNPNEGVAWLAHVGGFVAGAGAGLLLRPLLGPFLPGRRRDGDGWEGGFRGGYPGRT